MARKLGLLMALALSVLAPAGVSSLGLGEIRLNSYLNEPLDAEVTISVSGPEELDSLQVAVASEEAFERFGVERPQFLDDLTFVVDSSTPGSATLRIRSPEAVIEPFLTFLVEANWAGGKLLREYTVLLDPPLFLPEPKKQEQPAPPVALTPEAGVISRPAPQPQAAPPAPRATVTPPAVATPSSYGPVQKNDTLWRIASQVRPDRSVSVNQTMVALFEANPDAFDGNINLLQEGAVLNVPSRDTIARVGRAQATAEVRRQHTQWQPGDAAAAPAPIVAAATQAQPAEPVEERLELVVPGQPGTAPAPGVDTGAPSAEYLAEQQELNREMLSALSSLREELEETRRLIELKDAEIASLQGRIGELEPAAPAAGAAGSDLPVAEAPATEAPIDSPVAETPAGEFVAEPAPVEPETPAVEETPAPAVEPAPATPPATASAPAESGGLFSSIWTWILVALAVIGAVIFVWKRRQEETDESFGVLDTIGGTAPAPAAAPVAVAAAAEKAFLVEEQPTPGVGAGPAEAEPASAPAGTIDFDSTGTFTDTDVGIGDDEPTDVVADSPADETASKADYQYPFEDTIAGASGIDLDQSDPLAEADFHMAYGLYDQAADLIGKSVEREPDRADLRMKLLDILFVWGKEDRFLAEAEALREALGDDTSADWGRVVIMGRQICPDEPLFSGETETDVDVAVDASSPGEGAELGAAAGGLDFDIGAEQEEAVGDDLLDFDLGNTGERPMASADGISADQTAEMDIEDLGLDLDLGDATSEVLAGLAAAEAGDEQELDVNFAELQPDTGLSEALDDPDMLEGGTAEMLIPEGEFEDVSGNTAELTGLTEQLERAALAAGSEDLTELAEALDEPTVLATPEDMDGLTESLLQAGGEDQEEAVAGETPDEEAESSETLVAGDDESANASGLTEILDATMSMGGSAGTVVAETLEMPSVKEQEEESADATSELDAAGFATQRMTAVLEQPELDDEDTAQVEAIEQEDDPSLELDDITAALSVDLETTTELPRAGEDPGSDTLINEIFGADEATRLAPGIDILTQNDEADAQKEETVVAMPPDVTLDEVGTKLDLARAYIDMGDPDGAKSILEEVLNEGSENQKTEAKQLMDGVT